MSVRNCLALLLFMLACGCGKKEKSTDELISDLRKSNEKDRLIAARTLPKRTGDAAHVVPALIEALKDKDSDIRWSAVLGLGSFGEKAKDAIPALQALEHDRDPRVRKAALVAISRIDPNLVPNAGSNTEAGQ